MASHGSYRLTPFRTWNCAMSTWNLYKRVTKSESGLIGQLVSSELKKTFVKKLSSQANSLLRLLFMTMNAINTSQAFSDQYNVYFSQKDFEPNPSDFYNYLFSSNLSTDQSAPFDVNQLCQSGYISTNKSFSDSFGNDLFADLPKLNELSDLVSGFEEVNPLMTKHYVLPSSNATLSSNSNEDDEMIKSKMMKNPRDGCRNSRRHLSAEKRYRESINSKMDELRMMINCHDGNMTKLKKRQLLAATIQFIEKLKRKNHILTIENKYLRKQKLS